MHESSWRPSTSSVAAAELADARLTAANALRRRRLRQASCQLGGVRCGRSRDARSICGEHVGDRLRLRP